MKRLSLLVALGAVCAWSIDIPRIGFACDAQGRISVVNGIAGNFVLGDMMGGSVAFSWNGAIGVRKTDSALELWDSTGTVAATFDVPPGEAVIGFGPDNTTAWIYSPADRALVQVKPDGLQRVPAGVIGEAVLALTGGVTSVDIAIRREARLYIATFDVPSGSRTAEVSLAHTASSILFAGGGAIAGVDGSVVWITRADGSEWSVDTGVALTAMAWMGRDWIQISAVDRQFALRLRPGSDPVIFLLPQAVSQ